MSTTTYVDVALPMSTHNICFHGEITKLSCGYLLLPGAMIIYSYAYMLHLVSFILIVHEIAIVIVIIVMVMYVKSNLC